MLNIVNELSTNTTSYITLNYMLWKWTKQNQKGILNSIGNRSDTLNNKNDSKLIILLNNYYNG